MAMAKLLLQMWYYALSGHVWILCLPLAIRNGAGTSWPRMVAGVHESPEMLTWNNSLAQLIYGLQTTAV